MAVISSKKDRKALLPVRHPNTDFFVCDITDAIPKDDMASMEHPIFSLSTKPDHRMLQYEHNGNCITIKPGYSGLATIHDKDVLIYCISQLIAAMKAGERPQRTLHIQAFDLLVATNRPTGGESYERLRAALDRLSGTRIETNIVTGGVEIDRGFGLIDSWEIVRATKNGRMVSLAVSLSDWLFNAVSKHEVLTLHRDYFRLRKPMERRVYELARKHCGKNDDWPVSIEILHKKCGSSGNVRLFRQRIKQLVKDDHLPDYHVTLDGDIIMFRNRRTMPGTTKDSRSLFDYPQLDPDIYNEARLVAPGWDVYVLEQEWREWMSDPPRHPDAAFLGFCKKWYEKRGTPR